MLAASKRYEVEADRHLMRNVRYARISMAKELPLSPPLSVSLPHSFVFFVAVVCWLYCLRQESSQAKDDIDLVEEAAPL